MDEIEERERSLAARLNKSSSKPKESVKSKGNTSMRASLERELNGNSIKEELHSWDEDRSYRKEEYVIRRDKPGRIAVVEDSPKTRSSWEKPLNIGKKVTPTTVKNSNKFKQLLIIAQRNVSKNN